MHTCRYLHVHTHRFYSLSLSGRLSQQITTLFTSCAVTEIDFKQKGSSTQLRDAEEGLRVDVWAGAYDESV